MRVLIFVEDPGAALYLAGLREALAARRDEVILLTAGAMAQRDPVHALVPGEDAAALLARARPDALVAGTSENPDSFAFALIKGARAPAIPSFGAVDSAANAAWRYRGHTADPLAHAPDRLLVPDAQTRDAFTALGFPAHAITVTSHPALRRGPAVADRQALRHTSFPAAPHGAPVIVFVSELSGGLGEDEGRYRRSAAYTLSGTSGSDRRTDVSAEELVRAARMHVPGAWLVLRLHPKQDAADEAALAALFDQVSQSEAGTDIVQGADLVTGLTSILLVEAAAFARPVLSVLPDPAEHEWLGAAGEAIPAVSTRAALEDFLERRPWPEAKIAESLGEPAQAMAEAIANTLAETHL